MTSEVHVLEAGTLTEERWAPFGWLPVRDTDPRDGQSHLEFAWDDVHLNVIAHFTDEIPHVNGGLVCQMLFRHLTHTQAIMVLFTAGARPGIHVAVTDDLIAQGVQAGDIAKAFAVSTGGKGGGRPHFASAGVGDPTLLAPTRARASGIIKRVLKG